MRAALPLGADLLLDDVLTHLEPTRLPPTLHSVTDSNRRPGIPIRIAGETLHIPSRIYDRPLPASTAIPWPITGPTAPMELGDPDLTARARRLWLAWLSRHHNGYVRAAAITPLLDHPEPWLLPYFLALLGEPVVEVAETVTGRLDTQLLNNIGPTTVSAFIDDNQAFLDLLAARARSYWNAYYRRRFPTWNCYPPRQALMLLAAHTDER